MSAKQPSNLNNGSPLIQQVCNQGGYPWGYLVQVPSSAATEEQWTRVLFALAGLEGLELQSYRRERDGLRALCLPTKTDDPEELEDYFQRIREAVTAHIPKVCTGKEASGARCFRDHLEQMELRSLASRI